MPLLLSPSPSASSSGLPLKLDIPGSTAGFADEPVLIVFATWLSAAACVLAAVVIAALAITFRANQIVWIKVIDKAIHRRSLAHGVKY